MKRKDETDTTARPGHPDPAQRSEQSPETPSGGEGGPDTNPDTLPMEEAVAEAEATAEAEAAAAAAESARLTDRLLRLQADFDNFRKRMHREREDERKRAGEAVLADLIPILDNLDFGFQQAQEKPGGEAFAEGLRLIRTQLEETARKHGMEPIDAIGKPFDPREHEAVVYAPSESVPEGVVVAQTRRGYRLGDRLLRAAMVVVSSGKAGIGDGDAGGEE